MKGRIFLALISSIVISIHSSNARSINDIPSARESLLRLVSPRFYRSLLISPVEGWIVVRGDLVNDHLLGARVVHSELGGNYDKLALDLANNLQIVDYTRMDTSSAHRAVFVHLLVY